MRRLWAGRTKCQGEERFLTDKFQAYFLGRKVGRPRFPNVSTVMWPDPQGKGRKDRVVYVSADALAALRTCLAVRPAAVPGEVLFWNQKRPHRALSSKGMQKKMERYAKAAGIKASWHSLRHTFASNLLEEGAEVTSIKELLGHASMESSERYAKLSNQRVKQIYQQTIRKVIAKTRV